ncbi:MAG: Coenzyme F420 hydrogenase/dehydrogenase, beta subunit C-terminal domain [Desulfobacula sp.]|nr:Coenzyme F420 hydrogenase/dehydrogenase, beta subunit C-terminal domain [Desulfobacula sp.]
MNSIEFIRLKKLCAGCGACVPICPSNSIEIDESGHYNYPKINKDKCNDCGLCLKVCPGYSLFKNFESKNLNSDILKGILSTHVCNSKDEDIRYNSSSGGFITSILLYMLEKQIVDGAIVIRQSKKNVLNNEVYIAKTVTELLQSLGSRYSPSSNCTIFKKAESLRGKYVFVGKPCQIEGLINYQRIKKNSKFEIVLKIGLFCKHTPSRKGLYELFKKHNISIENITRFKYRGMGWPGYFLVENENREILKLPYLDCWVEFFASNRNIRCIVCDNPFASNADISVGDPWGKEFMDDKIGKSLVLLRSEIANVIYHDLLEDDFIESKKIDNKNLARLQKWLSIRKRNVFHIATAYNIVINKKIKLSDVFFILKNIIFNYNLKVFKYCKEIRSNIKE